MQWSVANIDGEAAREWEDLLDTVVQRQPDEIRPDTLTWALGWSVAGLSIDEATRWAGLPFRPMELPIAAATAARYGTSPSLVTAWTKLGVRVAVGDVPLIGELSRVGWITPALDLVATSDRVHVSRQNVLLIRLLAVPAASVLDAVRCGLELSAALELAEYGRAGGATAQFLDQLLHDRTVSPEIGARINVAITDIGDAIPRSLWVTPATPDARVVRSVHASLPKKLWDQFFSHPEEKPAPPDVDEANGVWDVDAWTRDGDTWLLSDPPEDRAVQPAMAWRDAHQVDALRRYLSTYLRFLEPDDWIQMSWPPEGHLTDAGLWSDLPLLDCEEHGTDWDDDCEQCAEHREAREHEEDPVQIHEEATWDWHVEVETCRPNDDGDNVDVEAERWCVLTTGMDPRTVHFR